MSSSATMQQAKTEAAQPARRQQSKASAIQSELSDLRPQATAQRQLQDTANNSPQSHQLNTFQQMAQNSARATQLKAMSAMMNAPAVQRVEEEEPLQAKSATETAQRDVADAADAPKPNNTGLPDQLKSGIESLSGMSMDHVKVHYNSAQPAQLNAHAYAQGSEIHVAPGQERHLPHEAWHVVQQAQGRVKPTIQMKDDVPVNDDAGLEREADAMGAKALENGLEARSELSGMNLPSQRVNPLQRLANKHALTPPQYQQRSGFTVLGWGRLTGPGGTVDLQPVSANGAGHAEDQLIAEANLILAGVPPGTYTQLEVWVSSSPCSTAYGTRTGVVDGCLEELEDFSTTTGLNVFVHAQKPYQPRGMGPGMKQNSVDAANGTTIPHDFDTRTGIASGLPAYAAPVDLVGLGSVAQLSGSIEASEVQKYTEEKEEKKAGEKGKFVVVYE